VKIRSDDYVLTFVAQGVSIFVTDIHVDVYKKLKVVFLIDRGVFRQFFTKKAYKKASKEGLGFYKDKKAFDLYQEELEKFCRVFEAFFKKEIRGKKYIDKKTLKQFFTYTIKLCKDYTKMNVEFTDKAYSLRETDSVIKRNLNKVSKFKDVIRSFMNKVLFEEDGYTSQLFKILKKQFQLKSLSIDDLTQKEILSLYGKKRNFKEAKQRQIAFVNNYNRRIIDQGTLAKRMIKLFKNSKSEVKVLKGISASLGKIVGKVKLINVNYKNLKQLNKEIAKMNKGDVLVAETTAPELMVACEKASAIVTDTGGLLSHAAIVSREFKIPCVVGTGIATKVFKDGDFVEVDANKGKIIKLNRRDR
jgi:phosphohistidine swiveling domain-containing protein